MTKRSLAADVERDLDDLRRDLERERPALAERLENVVERIRDGAPTEPAGYVSTGEAAAALGVSPNTIKKWVRLGFIRDFWTLPGSGYLKIARTEVERIRAAGGPEKGQA
jgi:hypothetical protein